MNRVELLRAIVTREYWIRGALFSVCFGLGGAVGIFTANGGWDRLGMGLLSIVGLVRGWFLQREIVGEYV